MNDSELEKALKAARVPDRPAEHWEAFPHRVLGALPGAAGRRPAADRPWAAWAGWAGALAAAVLVAGVFLKTKRPAAAEPEAYAALQDSGMLSQVFAMFPHQVQALVEDERGVRLVLSAQADVPSSPPLWIEIQGPGSRRAAITFSGQNLQIAGDRVEVLANPQGEVTLVGDHVFWSSDSPGVATAGLHIRARILASL